MARAWYIVSSSILLNFSSLRKIGDALQVRRQLTQIGVGGGLLRYAIKQLFLLLNTYFCYSIYLEI